jgi:hypothetical protein
MKEEAKKDMILSKIEFEKIERVKQIETENK